MSSRLFTSVPLSLLLFACAHAAELAAPKDYKAGGNKDSVKDWKARDYSVIEAGKAGYQSYCVYVYDAAPKRNVLAFHLEDKEGLAHPDVKEKLAKFTKIKIKNDGKDAKGWPEALLKSAENGATLMLLSGDMTMMVTFDKSKDANERSAKAIVAAAASIQTYDDKRKELNAKADKEREAKLAREAEIAAAARKEKEAKEEPGFSIEIKKPPPKPPAKKSANKKADPKPVDPPPADPKKDPKKAEEE